MPHSLHQRRRRLQATRVQRKEGFFAQWRIAGLVLKALDMALGLSNFDTSHLRASLALETN